MKLAFDHPRMHPASIVHAALLSSFRLSLVAIHTLQPSIQPTGMSTTSSYRPTSAWHLIHSIPLPPSCSSLLCQALYDCKSWYRSWARLSARSRTTTTHVRRRSLPRDRELPAYVRLL
ncbi:hypothetical protein L227DRAFT_384047 [Lentinus tigrinus ALCF2SS1-6]|uniref:Uncharacterized protein n=1 Tax=Lentinus tigrinus ALCF2SS1-6 TaxID=1328759 RepID=A0A5C2RRY7_9APHY|nr:hypothetical protein L227DRAFT_384047 [Lentinus tigrinus ALCF2SS1-6]